MLTCIFFTLIKMISELNVYAARFSWNFFSNTSKTKSNIEINIPQVQPTYTQRFIRFITLFPLEAKREPPGLGLKLTLSLILNTL